MKVLVYGSGVIGCYLAHVLCTAENDVTLLARRPEFPMSNWRELKAQIPCFKRLWLLTRQDSS